MPVRNFTWEQYSSELDKECTINKLDSEQLNDAYKKYKESRSLELREIIFYNHAKLVLSVISNNFTHLYKYLDKMDLVQEGNKGLLRAIDSFDPEKGIQFSTFATACIKNEIRTYIDASRFLLKLTEEEKLKYKEISKICDNFVQDHGREPTFNDLLEITKDKYDEKTLNDILCCSPASIALEDYTDEDKTKLVSETVPSDEDSTIIAKKNLDNENLLLLLNEKLDEDERIVFIYFNGLFGNEKLSLEEIGKKFFNGITKQAISKKLISANNKLGL